MRHVKQYISDGNRIRQETAEEDKISKRCVHKHKCPKLQQSPKWLF